MTTTMTLPDQTQSASNYKNNIDATIRVLAEVAANFAAHEAAIPDMTVVIDAGKLWDGNTHTAKIQQTTSAFVAPITNPRIDRIAIDTATGNLVVIPGTEAASPVVPSYSNGQFPLCQVALVVGQTSIVNANIIDERPLINAGGPSGFRGCLAYLPSAESMPINIHAAIYFRATAYDTDGIHSNTVAPYNFVVPAGVTKIRMSATISVATGSATDRHLYFSKNGNWEFFGGAWATATDPGGMVFHMSITSSVIPVVAGDFFRVVFVHGNATALDMLGVDSLGYQSCASMEIIE